MPESFLNPGLWLVLAELKTRKVTLPEEDLGDSDSESGELEGEGEHGDESDPEEPEDGALRVCVTMPPAAVVTHTAEADAEYRRQLDPLGKHGAVSVVAPAAATTGDSRTAGVAGAEAPATPPPVATSPRVTLEAAFRSMKAIVRDQLGVDLTCRGNGHPRTYGKAPSTWIQRAGPDKGASP